MRDFSFSGINISHFGVHYAPDRPDWHIWDDDYSVVNKTVDSQDGGQWYGSSVRPKEFNLRCYFEDITEFQLAFIIGLFERNRFGDLIFDERPWLVYKARITKRPNIVKYPTPSGRYSGVITVYLTAYYPFAKSNIHVLEDNEDYLGLSDRLKNTTGILYRDRTPKVQDISESSRAIGQFEFYLLNGGNAKADTVIRIAGDVGEGVVIHNATLGRSCKVTGLTEANTSSEGKWLEIYSQTGECFITNGNSRQNGWAHHDAGYIQLAHTGIIRRGIGLKFEGNTIKADIDVFIPSDTGKHIWAESGWVQIVSVTDARTITVDPPAPVNGIGSGDIVLLNKIVVTPLSTMSLTKFEVDYYHTFT